MSRVNSYVCCEDVFGFYLEHAKLEQPGRIILRLDYTVSGSPMHQYMNYEVSIWYDSENKRIDFVKFAEAFGARGERVEGPNEIRPAIERALWWMDKMKKPALIDIIVERETDASMGASIDAVREFEEEREAEKKKGKLKEAA